MEIGAEVSVRIEAKSQESEVGRVAEEEEEEGVPGGSRA